MKIVTLERGVHQFTTYHIFHVHNGKGTPWFMVSVTAIKIKFSNQSLIKSRNVTPQKPSAKNNKFGKYGNNFFKWLIIYLYFDRFLCMRLIDYHMFIINSFLKKNLVNNIIIK
jgi:hypothetical protein